MIRFNFRFRVVLLSALLFNLSSWAASRIDFIEYELSNGLHVILHQNNEAPVVSTYVLYHVGSKDERPDRTGFAHFFEHLMFEGTKNISRGELDKLIKGSGGNFNASTSFDRTDYYINVPSNELELALWIESERMLHAVVNEEGVETQREVVKEERRSRYDNQPYGSFFENMAKMVFADTPYAWTPIGSVQYIDQATIEEFRAFYKKWYVPNNAILSIAGDIDIENTKALVEKYFVDIPRGAELERAQFAFELDASPQESEVIEPITPLPGTVHIWRAPPMTHEDANALDLLINILATGNSSRLYRKLVDLERAAVNSSAFTYLQEKAGMVAVFAIGNRGVDIAQLDELIKTEVENLVENGISDEEWQKAMNIKEAELASSFGTMQNRAESLAYYRRWYGATDRINDELDLYRNVTKEKIQEVARKYLTQERRYTLHYPVPEKR